MGGWATLAKAKDRVFKRSAPPEQMNRPLMGQCYELPSNDSTFLGAPGVYSRSQNKGQQNYSAQNYGENSIYSDFNRLQEEQVYEQDLRNLISVFKAWMNWAFDAFQPNDDVKADEKFCRAVQTAKGYFDSIIKLPEENPAAGRMKNLFDEVESQRQAVDFLSRVESVLSQRIMQRTTYNTPTYLPERADIINEIKAYKVQSYGSRIPAPIGLPR
ncbi:hypothetical protein SCHPADRAFT_946469 [Schizopora paradoxa]|uniref:Uncharacterized protein n=1 Tax=Schizopora paradoxa TaxID=27342 RepID=A0A0H2R3R9_9AGAM|nr:hypothetical protein SCHPADRAFT_946469 [Schizopora paradoxa]